MAAWMRSIWPAVSEPYLSSVVQRLARGGLLRSLRGISGGYVLGRPAEEITLRDVVELLDGVFGDGNRCGLSLEDRCPAQGRCSIQRRLAMIERQFLQSLQVVTIAELAQQVVIPRKVKGV
jgi:Rrf2 family protein